MGTIAWPDILDLRSSIYDFIPAIFSFGHVRPGAKTLVQPMAKRKFLSEIKCVASSSARLLSTQSLTIVSGLQESLAFSCRNRLLTRLVYPVIDGIANIHRLPDHDPLTIIARYASPRLFPADHH